MKYLTRQEELILLAVFQLKENAYLVTIRTFLKKYTGKNWSVSKNLLPSHWMSGAQMRLSRASKNPSLVGFSFQISSRRLAVWF